MKYSIIKKTTNLFYRLAQENAASEQDSGETELAEVKPHPEFDKLVDIIETKDLIPTVPNDGNYSRDVQKGFPIHIAMVDSVVIPHVISDDEPALLIRFANFIDEVEYQRRPGYPKQKIKFTGAGDYEAYALELVALAGGKVASYDFTYIQPDGNIKPVKNKNSNFAQWVAVTFKKD
jgi:hypothetical protein